MPHGKKYQPTGLDSLAHGFIKLFLAQHAKPFYGPMTPLYLDKKNVYQSNLLAGQDPIRPLFGHWGASTIIAGTSPEDPYIDELPGWEADLSGFSPETEKLEPYTAARFIKPSLKWKEPNQDTKTFRVLAQKKIRTGPTAPLSNAYTNWTNFKNHLDTIANSDSGTPYEKAIYAWVSDHSNATANAATLKAILALALDAGYLPHYHEGYIDEFGNGFTTGVFIAEHWLQVYNTMKALPPSAVSVEDIARAMPLHHTHYFYSGYMTSTEHQDIVTESSFGEHTEASEKIEI